MADYGNYQDHQGYPAYQTVSRPGLSGFLEQLGERAARRAEPRLGIALAGVGVLMVLAGILVWAGERLAVEDDGGLSESPDRSLGIILSMAVIAGGFTLLLKVKRGPLATAGVAASALGVPVLLGFATYDPVVRQINSGDFDSFESEPLFSLPFQLDVIALVSLAVWLVCYARVPYARGRVFYLAASAFVLWLYVLEKVEENSAIYIVTLPLNLLFFPIYAFSGEEPQVPDPSTIGGWSLAIAALYYAAAILLDRRGHRGASTAFVAAAFVISPLAIGHLAGDMEGIGTGILLVLLGVPLAYYGVLQGRRATAWAWAFGAGFGLVVIAADVFEKSAAGFGVTAISLGVTVVYLAHVISRYYAEPDEMEPGPSRFTPPQRPGPLAAAWVGGPGYPTQYPAPQPPQVPYGAPMPVAPAPPSDDHSAWMPDTSTTTTSPDAPPRPPPPQPQPPPPG